MTDPGSILTALGLEQYRDALISEGFDTWETLLDIQESDLDALNFKLGHRRKLQREIANYRGVSYDRTLGSPAIEGAPDYTKTSNGAKTATGHSDRGVPGGSDIKRKYRRHPKVDENAPERPPSAYVIFSNKIRVDVRGQNLSFTEIAKLVGDEWQKLSPPGKEPFEAQATSAKERYNTELAAYKKTDEHKEHMQYLADFKVKHGINAEGKRQRLQHESNGNVSTRLSEVPRPATVHSSHVRVGSTSSTGSASIQGFLPSPSSTSVGPFSAFPVQGVPSNPSRLTSPHADSPPPLLIAREARFPPPLSTHSSVSDESSVSHSDQPDPLPRTAQLSLNSSTTPALQGSGPGLPGPTGPGRMSGASRRAVRAPITLQHYDSSISTSSSSTLSRASTSASSILPPTTPTDEPWRAQISDAAATGYLEKIRPMRPPLASHPAASYVALPLPTLIAPERPSEMSHDINQRILPPFRSSPQDQQQRLSSLSRAGSQPLQFVALPTGPRRIEEDGSRPDHLESEAVNTLALLAYCSSKNDDDSRNGRTRPAS